MFAWLETSAVANWVALSLWAYPVLLSLHGIGLAVVVGIFFMRDLRLLGVVHGLEPATFIPLGRLAFIGFGINAVSGALLFTSQATALITSTPFLLKLSCVIAGMMLALSLQTRLGLQFSGPVDESAIGGTTRLLALSSLLCWLGAIIAGRLIAYL